MYYFKLQNTLNLFTHFKERPFLNAWNTRSQSSIRYSIPQYKQESIKHDSTVGYSYLT